ncbi:MAG: nucleotidyl transferase AbiEii/AbiGii toxin family protein [Ignavibacteriaceae bacterium]|nr:nucleotidyl transferase AbiEii/AbiGii toxin family protein [Ignavibacteriaceae bacterium]
MAEVNKDLRALELLEIEILDLLNSNKILNQLYFGGGTMLRLCHNLNRYSTDLDFWVTENVDYKKIFSSIERLLSPSYNLIDSQNKFYSLLFQIKSPTSKRSLNIEIRKEQSNFEWERKIAFSRYTTKQVQLNGLTLRQMMKNKISALISRKIIRDCFDIDFLLKRGIPIEGEKETLLKMLEIIKSFKEKDFKVTLGSVLDSGEREFYNENKFNFLQQEIIAKLSSH